MNRIALKSGKVKHLNCSSAYRSIKILSKSVLRFFWCVFEFKRVANLFTNIHKFIHKLTNKNLQIASIIWSFNWVWNSSDCINLEHSFFQLQWVNTSSGCFLQVVDNFRRKRKEKSEILSCWFARKWKNKNWKWKGKVRLEAESGVLSYLKKVRKKKTPYHFFQATVVLKLQLLSPKS